MKGISNNRNGSERKKWPRNSVNYNVYLKIQKSTWKKILKNSYLHKIYSKVNIYWKSEQAKYKINKELYSTQYQQKYKFTKDKPLVSGFLLEIQKEKDKLVKRYSGHFTCYLDIRFFVNTRLRYINYQTLINKQKW